MDSKKLRIAENALRQIAEREGTTVDAVREEIRAAIAMPEGVSVISPSLSMVM